MDDCAPEQFVSRIIGEHVDFLCCDVSFISVTLILPAVTGLLRPGGQMVILIKPQFEVGKGQVGKGGIVRDPALHRAACEKVERAVRAVQPGATVRCAFVTGTGAVVEIDSTAPAAASVRQRSKREIEHDRGG